LAARGSRYRRCRRSGLALDPVAMMPRSSSSGETSRASISRTSVLSLISRLPRFDP
jgi:hypothetical protein